MGSKSTRKPRPQKRPPKGGGKKATDSRPLKTRAGREIVGICLFFLVLFSAVSLLSYSPSDPSWSTAAGTDDVHNLFGVIGAYFAGALIDLFGIGAFWIPLLLLISGRQFLRQRPTRAQMATALGGALLVVTTGALLALKQDAFEIFDSRFSAGGVVGIPLGEFLARYSNTAGAAVILAVLFLVGFILATRFSLVTFVRTLIGWSRIAADRFQTAGKSGRRLKMNSKLTLKVFLVLALTALVGANALAESPDEDPKAAIKKMDGKELYKNFCKVCHAEDSEAGEYTPMSLIMDQWDEFFDDTFAETHKELTCPKDEKTKLMDVMDKDMIKKIRKFCVDHAADSEQPMTCG